jgi:hypothetical protein
MTDRTAREIAEGLSGAQREMLLSRLSPEWSDVPRIAGAPNALRGWASRRIGMLEARAGRDFYHIRLTPLGLSVRQILEQETLPHD